MLIGVSNIFGMAGLYVPFVYLVDYAKQNVSASVGKLSVKGHFVTWVFLLFAGHRSQQRLVSDLDHRHYEHIWPCAVRLRGRLSMGRLAAAEQHMPGDLNGGRWRDTAVLLVCVLCGGGDILRHCRVYVSSLAGSKCSILYLCKNTCVLQPAIFR